jgi:hypothetical protein
MKGPPLGSVEAAAREGRRETRALKKSEPAGNKDRIRPK